MVSVIADAVNKVLTGATGVMFVAYGLFRWRAYMRRYHPRAGRRDPGRRDHES